MALFIILGFFGVSAIVSLLQRRAALAAWGEVAPEFGLALNDGVNSRLPEMHGTHADGRISVEVHTTGSGKNKTKWTRYTISHVPIGPPLALTRQGAMSTLANKFLPEPLRQLAGITDHELGDPFFDDAVVIDSSYPDEVREFLTPTRRAAVLKLLSNFHTATFTDRSITVSTRGLETKPEPMRSTLRQLIAVASVMSDSEAVDQLLAHQQAGDLRHAAEGLHQLNQQSPNAFTRQLEAEAWTELGDHDSAAVVFDDLTKLLPENPDVANWSRVAHTPAPPPPRLAAPPVTPTATDRPEPPTTGPDQQAVIDDVFDPARMSWQIVEHFEATYQNQPVSWAGKVTTYSRYRHDSDFGEGPGIKATVLLGTVGRSDFVSSEVHAILELPALVELERGTHISFTGVLTTVDRFSRKLQVRSASLTG